MHIGFNCDFIPHITGRPTYRRTSCHFVGLARLVRCTPHFKPARRNQERHMGAPLVFSFLRLKAVPLRLMFSVLRSKAVPLRLMFSVLRLKAVPPRLMFSVLRLKAVPLRLMFSVLRSKAVPLRLMFSVLRSKAVPLRLMSVFSSRKLCRSTVS
ncbi:hypothetical protein [Lentibacillus salinarum]|uniref:Uncharacterized protein n=1 Tax=Lentibacillus salinarum TaxID=446820 RepID=A0ABW3ZSM3_9BACI